MKNVLLLIFLFLNVSQAKEIAITFDDSPRFARGLFDGPTRAKKLIKALKDNNVKEVAFFSVSKNLDKEGRQRLKMYADAGHIIANHTHSHPSINKLIYEDFAREFLIADKKLSRFKNYKKWFRYPFLREGKDEFKRNRMRALLRKKGYINAYITSNNYDWHIERIFQLAVKRNKKFNFDKMRKFYVDVLMESIEFYEKMAVKYLERSPKHVLLLHEMDTAALYIGDLIKALRNKGWKIITPTEAYQDPIAIYKAKTLLGGNPGRIGEVAIDKGAQLKDLWHGSCDEEYLDKRFRKEVSDF